MLGVALGTSLHRGYGAAHDVSVGQPQERAQSAAWTPRVGMAGGESSRGRRIAGGGRLDRARAYCSENRSGSPRNHGLLVKSPSPVHFHRCAGERRAHDHSMTWSARSRMDCGIVRPNALAVLRLITSSNFDACSIGRSAGFAPLRILSTYVAVRRNKSLKLAP